MFFMRILQYAFPVTFSLISYFVACSTGTSENAAQEYMSISDSIVETALKEQRGYQFLKELTDIGPRLTGSETGMQAIHWAESKMKELGLANVRLQPVSAPHWERGATESATIRSSNHFNGRSLNVAALGGTEGTPSEGVTAQVVEVKTFDELRAMGENVHGKIIFYNRPMPMDRLDSFAAYGSAGQQRFAGPNEAAKLGAVGVIVRSLTMRKDNVPHTGGTTYEQDVKKIPAVAVGIQDADLLSDALKQDPKLEITIMLSARNLPNTETFNVIGEFPGSEKPEEVIVVGGHLDSWDKGVGAHDDGSGCMQALEVIDILKRLNIQPKRTIRVVLFANEENGGAGADAYAEYAANEKDTHYAVIESDRGAFSPRGFSVEEASAIPTLSDWLPYLRKAGIDWIRQGGSGADVSKITNATLHIGYIPDSQRYFDVHHSDNDTFESVNAREFELGSAALTILVYLLSESD